MYINFRAVSKFFILIYIRGKLLGSSAPGRLVEVVGDQ